MYLRCVVATLSWLAAAQETGLESLATKVLHLEDKLIKSRDEMASSLQQAAAGLMHAQASAAESLRMSGGSGAMKVRTYKVGNRAYHSGAHGGSGGMLASHNHANHEKTVGLGEFAAVMNGVPFRTRHNDYALNMPGKFPIDDDEVQKVPRPPVPPSVLQAGSLDNQIAEMRMYFRAFKEQNISIRDYRPYFRPTLCYLEGWWEKLDSDKLVEPFESDRHHIAAVGWKDLVEKIRFYDMTGGKDTAENIPWLPTQVLNVEVVDGRVQAKFAKWNYRILCHPIDGDVELVRLNLHYDHALMKQQRSPNWERYMETRIASFQVDPRLPLKTVQKNPNAVTSAERNYLDLLMEQIPGKDGYGANLTDSIMNPRTSRLEPYQEGDPARAESGTAINRQNTLGPLNTAYYSRYFAGATDAMGVGTYRRGYNDGYLFAAMTTHERVAPVSMINSGSKIKPGDICFLGDGVTPCPRIEQKWTYALPLEIIYLNPLNQWNPHGFEVQRYAARGIGSQDDPYPNVGYTNQYYKTPVEFFGSCNGHSPTESADTDVGARYVLDREGVPRAAFASGVQILLRCIDGVGKVRQRYIISPLHAYGDTSYKEAQALAQMIQDRQVPEGEPEPEVEDPGTVVLALTAATDGHAHEVFLASDEVDTLQTGTTIWATSSFVEGHTHQVKLISTHNPVDTSTHEWTYDMVECLTGGTTGPDPAICVDGHASVGEEYTTV